MTIRWIQDGDTNNAQTLNRPLMDYITNETTSLANKSTTIYTTYGVAGEGNLSQDLTIRGVTATKISTGVIQFATNAEVMAGTREDLAVSSSDVSGVPLGVGNIHQSWESYAHERQMGVVYTNTTDSPICVSVIIMGDRNYTTLKVNDVIVSQIFDGGGQSGIFDQPLVAVVPVGSTYIVSNSSTVVAQRGGVAAWHELR